jgi:hypothetical protein
VTPLPYSTHGGGHTHRYEIARVQHDTGKTVVVLTGDHGLAIDGDVTREVYFPRRTIRGANRFVIPLEAALGAP